MSESEFKDKSDNKEKLPQSLGERLKNIFMTEINTPNLGVSDLISNIIPRHKDTSIKTDHADYTQLRDFLTESNWKEADQETWKIIRLVAGIEKEGWLTPDSVLNFPCEDLQLLDQLWLQFSQGHFGFSVQKRIYQTLGGKSSFDEKIWLSLGDRVGWRNHGNWLNYLELQFDKNALEGHLPVEPIKVTLSAKSATMTKRGAISFSIFSRLETCQKTIGKIK
jgi:GUN4-like